MSHERGWGNEMTDSNETKKGKEPLIIQQKVYDMIMYAYPAIEQFPKSQKFSLAQDMKKCLDAIMRYVIAANKKYTKKTTLQELDIENEALKIYIRMAFELGYLPPKKYEIWSGMAVEVGKMIGGWIKAAWDSQPLPGIDKQPDSGGERMPGQVEIGDDETFTCSGCGATIAKVVKEYSEKNMGMILCRKCQNKFRRGELGNGP